MPKRTYSGRFPFPDCLKHTSSSTGEKSATPINGLSRKGSNTIGKVSGLIDQAPPRTESMQNSLSYDSDEEVSCISLEDTATMVTIPAISRHLTIEALFTLLS